MARPRGKWKTRQPNGRPAGMPQGKVPVQYGELKKTMQEQQILKYHS